MRISLRPQQGRVLPCSSRGPAKLEVVRIAGMIESPSWRRCGGRRTDPLSVLTRTRPWRLAAYTGMDASTTSQALDSSGSARMCRSAYRCSTRFAMKQWMLIAVVLTAVVAVAAPMPGQWLYPYSFVPVLVALFFLQGLTLHLHEIRAAMTLRALPVHIFIQTFSLVVTPCTYYGIVYRWQWEVKLKVLSRLLADGTLVALCMPTTGSTSLVFTQQAGGDAALAALHCCFAQFLGLGIAPLLAPVLLNEKALDLRILLGRVGKLVLEVALPLILGIALNGLIAWRRPGGLSSRARTLIGKANALILVLLLWMIFSRTAAAGSHGLSVAALSRLAGWILAVHLVVLLFAWGAGCALSAPRRIAFALVGSQKTEGMAIAIVALIFEHEKAALGELSLPAVMYHSVQMIVAALLLPFLKAWGEKHDQTRSSASSTRRNHTELLRDVHDEDDAGRHACVHHAQRGEWGHSTRCSLPSTR